MNDVDCSRCGSTREGLERTPLPGDPGRAVLEQTCKSCWGEWLEMQIKLINEYQLSPAQTEHYEFLIKEMKTFLSLSPARDPE